MKPSRKPLPRIFHDGDLHHPRVDLSARQAHYLRDVLRLKRGDSLLLFNGRGEERTATIDTLCRERSEARITGTAVPLPESPLELFLVQALVKSSAMDLIIQKAAELGVREVFPVFAKHGVVRLDDNRAERRADHWQRIARGACQQCGRHSPPAVHAPRHLADTLERLPPERVGATLHPGAGGGLDGIARRTGAIRRLCLLVGPEGGLSGSELERADAAGFQQVSLGPRILRTETAVLAACTWAQALWGDLATSGSGRGG